MVCKRIYLLVTYTHLVLKILLVSGSFAFVTAAAAVFASKTGACILHTSVSALTTQLLSKRIVKTAVCPT